MLSSGEDTLEMILQVANLRNAAPAIELQLHPDIHDRIRRERGWSLSNRDQLAFLTMCEPMKVTITPDMPHFPGFSIIRSVT